jgi:L-iditol 2-dehydrogenase
MPDGFEIGASMRALVYRGPNLLRVESVPVPRIRSDELLVRVAVCGVCPTDIKKIKYGTVAPPRIFGHETAGTIVRTGAKVRGWREGDRVALHHHVPCGKCHACRHRAFAQCPQYKMTGITAGFEPAGGGFAEYVRVMPFVLPGVVRIPRRNEFVEGALLEPVNTVLKAVKRLPLLAGDTAWVIGQGPIGLLFTALLAQRQVRVLATDPLAPRLRNSRKWGAHWAFSPADPRFQRRWQQVKEGKGIDVVVVTAPVDAAVAEALAAVRGAGVVLLFAHTRRGSEVPVELSAVCVDEKDLIGSYSADFSLQREVAKVVFSRKLDVRRLVSHRFPLEHGAEAIELASKPSANSLKIVIDGGEISSKTPLRLGRNRR